MGISVTPPFAGRPSSSGWVRDVNGSQFSGPHPEAKGEGCLSPWVMVVFLVINLPFPPIVGLSSLIVSWVTCRKIYFTFSLLLLLISI